METNIKGTVTIIHLIKLINHSQFHIPKSYIINCFLRSNNNNQNVKFDCLSNNIRI